MTADAVTAVWPYVLELCRALGEHEVDVLLAVMGPAPSSERRRAIEELPNVQVEHKPYALEWMNSPWSDVRSAGDWLLKLEEGWQPEVVHLNSYSLATRDFRAPRVVVGHSCACSWHEAVRGGEPPARWATYRRRVSEGLAAADAVIAPTRWMLKALDRHHGRPTGEVIPNARSASSFHVEPCKDPMVLAVGRVWDESKNLLMLDQAAEALDWPLMIAGGTDAPKKPTGKFCNAGLLGELPTKAVVDWLARASIFAHPAKYEPFGLSVLEAALSGCALVLADIPSLRETWGAAAVFVDPDQPSAWTGTLNRLIADRGGREELARRALERARCFSPGAQATAYLASYEAVIERRRPARAS